MGEVVARNTKRLLYQIHANPSQPLLLLSNDDSECAASVYERQR